MSHLLWRKLMCGMSVLIWNSNEIIYTELEQSVLINK
jgi:hypothetical protein